MWGRLFLGLLLAVAVVAGYPYASLIVNRIIGTNTVVFTEPDGLQRTLIMGPDAPRPAWLPILPHSLIVQAGHWMPSPGREIAGDVELLTHSNVEEIKRFYLDALNSAGFDTHDAGQGTLNAPAAAYFGIANMLQGYRGDDDLTITVTTRTAAGLIVPSRTVQIHWQRWDQTLPGGRAAAAADATDSVSFH
jgi:hypothetical protein